MKTVRNLLTTATAILLLMPAAPSWSASGKPSNSKIAPSVAVTDNLLTIQVRNMPLKDLLQKIAKQADVEITVHGPADAPVSADFDHSTLEEGLKRVTPDFNIAFTYSGEKKGQDKPKVERIALYSKTAAVGNAPPLVFSGSSRPSAEPSSQSQAASPSPPPVPPLPSLPPVPPLPSLPPVPPLPSVQLDATEVALPSPSKEELAKLMKSADTVERVEALFYLVEAKDESSIALLSEMLVNDSNENIRLAAAEALRNNGNQQTVVALGKALSDKSAMVRHSIVQALGEIGGDEAVALIKKAMQDSDEMVRVMAKAALEMAEDADLDVNE